MTDRKTDYKNDPYRAGYLAALKDVLRNAEMTPTPTGFRIEFPTDWIGEQMERLERANISK